MVAPRHRRPPQSGQLQPLGRVSFSDKGKEDHRAAVAKSPKSNKKSAEAMSPILISFINVNLGNCD
jgi:hypothetical protein